MDDAPGSGTPHEGDDDGDLPVAISLEDPAARRRRPLRLIGLIAALALVAAGLALSARTAPVSNSEPKSASAPASTSRVDASPQPTPELPSQPAPKAREVIEPASSGWAAASGPAASPAARTPGEADPVEPEPGEAAPVEGKPETSTASPPAREPAPEGPSHAPSPALDAILRKQLARVASRRFELAAPSTSASLEGRAATHMLAGSKALEDGRFSVALQQYRAASSLHSANADALYGMALAQVELKQDRSARSSLRRVLALNPSHPEATLLAGYLAQLGGDPATARTHYTRYLELQPEGEYAAELRGILTTLAAPNRTPANPARSTSKPSTVIE